MSSPLAPLDAQACYRALSARDARFDGHWFVAVRSTGVYCRPVCRVRTPKAQHCSFFALAAGAEAAGYRPCLKCRPELAPRAFSVMEASRSLAQAARERLDGGLDDSLAALAARLGVTDRHLRRIFQAEFGVGPLQYLQTRRLLAAKQLLTDTPLSVAEVARHAGFGSQRAFNAAWQRHYGLAPQRLRRAGAAAASGSLLLGYRPPYALAPLLEFLEARAVPGVEQVDTLRGTITRSVGGGQLRVRFEPLHCRVQVQLSSALWAQAPRWLQAVRQWLDLDAEPQAIDPLLAPLGAPPGLRLPGGVDRFELAVRAVLGQQVSVKAARTLATRLVQGFGQPLPDAERLDPAVAWAFPTPRALAQAGAQALAEIGLPRARAAALQGLAQAWPGLQLAAPPPFATPDAAETELQQLAGIGPWTAAYLVMRGWPWPDRFLPGDVVLRQQLARRPDLDPAQFAPYRSYAVLALWRAALEIPA